MQVVKVNGADVWTAYLRQLDASDRTRETYGRALRSYRSWLDGRGMGPTDATRETVISYRDDMAREHKAATVNCYLTAVRSLYSWLEAVRAYPNVAAGVKGERTSARSPKRALTKEQARVITAKRGDSLGELRDLAMVNLMVRRGLRTIEVSRANVGDIRDMGGRSVLFVQGKGYDDKGDFVVLGTECMGPIAEYLRARGEVDRDAPLFAATGNRNGGGRMTTRSISRIVRARMDSLGITGDGLTAHSLRHTAVTFALRGGATPQEVQAMARHRSIETTMIYAHNIDRMEGRAERAADGFLDGPRAEHRLNTEVNTLLPAAFLKGEHNLNTLALMGEHRLNTGLAALFSFAEHELCSQVNTQVDALGAMANG